MSKKLIGWTTAALLLAGAGATLALPSDATASASATVTIEIKCDDATHIYWRELNTSRWTQLASELSQAPVISAGDNVTTTFRFVQHSGSNYDVIFKPSASGSAQSLPASFPLDAGETQDIYASKAGSTPKWYAGYVKVSGG